MTMTSSPFLSLPALALFALASILVHFLATYLTCRIRSVPGPWHSTFTHYVLKYHIVRRRRMYYIHSLHQKYGPIVRIAPGEIDISDLQTVQAVHKPAGSAGFPKSAWYESFANPVRATAPAGEEQQYSSVETSHNIFATRDNKTHAAQRRLFARAFSNSNMLANWDDLVRSKVRLAVSRIRADAEAGRRQVGPVGPGGGGGADVLKWWTLMASDVVSHLMFGESFHSLELGKQTPLIDALQRAGFATILSLEFPLVGLVGRHLPLAPVRAMFHADAVVDEYGALAYRNLRSGDAHHKKNIFSQALATADDAKELAQGGHMTRFIEQTVRHESTNFLFAGSDTTAATLTYLVWAVLRQGPRLRDALEQEIAGLGPDLAHEELQDRGRAPLLNSVIDEALRLYAAAPSSLPRDVPAGGATLFGYFIPEGVVVSVQAYTIHRDPNLFQNPLQ